MTKVDNSKTRLNKGMIITVVLIGVMFFSVVWSIDGPDKPNWHRGAHLSLRFFHAQRLDSAC